VNRVAPVEVTLTSEKTLIESSPKMYKKLLAEYIAVMLPCKVSSVNVSEPALTDVKSNGLTEDE
jgi:hypothetical protein